MTGRAWLMGVCLWVCAGAQAADDFDLALPIEVPDGAGLVRIELPEAVYRAAERADLGDLRVINGAGEPLPIARLPQRPAPIVQRTERRPVALASMAQPAGADLSISSRNGGQSVDIDLRSTAPVASPSPGYLVDAEGFDAPVDAIELRWAGTPVFEAGLNVSVSDDLKTWRDVARRVPVLALGEPGERIEQARVDLPAVRARYLRLVWVDGSPGIALERVDLVHATAADRPRVNSIDLRGSVEGGQLAFLSPGVFPVTGISLVLADDARVVSATVSSRAVPTAPWRPRARLLGYRLDADGGVAESGVHPVPTVRDTLWRVSVDGGVPRAVPGLRLSWQTESMVFVARGQGPYRLLVGQRGADAAWQPPQALIPGYGTAAQVSLADGVVATPERPVESRARPASWADDPAQWLLWGVLALGVVVLGLMARSLLRELRSDAGSDSR